MFMVDMTSIHGAYKITNILLLKIHKFSALSGLHKSFEVGSSRFNDILSLPKWLGHLMGWAMKWAIPKYFETRLLLDIYIYVYVYIYIDIVDEWNKILIYIYN